MKKLLIVILIGVLCNIKVSPVEADSSLYTKKEQYTYNTAWGQRVDLVALREDFHKELNINTFKRK